MTENTQKSFAEMRKEFELKFNTKILPTVRPYESTRKMKHLLTIILFCIFLSCVIFLIYACFSPNRTLIKFFDEKVCFIILLLCVLSFWGVTTIKKNFENTIKEKIMPIVCGCFDNMSWSHGNYYYGKFFSESCVVPEFNEEEYDDIFDIVYSGVHIEIVEAKYQLETGSGENKQTTTVFEGIIVKLDMNKKFSSHTVVTSDIVLLDYLPSNDLHRIELEDPEFNKKFKIFTNDDLESRYLLTPSFMEKLKNISLIFAASSVSYAFFNSCLIIALDTRKDIFSLCSLQKPVDDPEQYFMMYEEIISIMKLVNHFRLNQK